MPTKPSLSRQSTLGAISADWKVRIAKAFHGTLLSRSGPQCSPDGETVMRGESLDGRGILELSERDGMVVEASLQLALPGPDEIIILRLKSWSILYLRALFPGWNRAEHWAEHAAIRAMESGASVKRSGDYRVFCQFDPVARVLDYRVVRQSRDRR